MRCTVRSHGKVVVRCSREATEFVRVDLPGSARFTGMCSGHLRRLVVARGTVHAPMSPEEKIAYETLYE